MSDGVEAGDAELRARAADVARALDASQTETERVVEDLEAFHVACAQFGGDARALIKELAARDADARRASADAKEDEFLALSAELAELERARADLEGDAADPRAERLRHAASLFANITKITWAPDCGDGVIAGVVAHDEACVARRFRIETAGRSDFDVAAELWALVGG
mmetsp:Transcript_26825/g.80454  ORF Transcript_26825/g.80454 Transcript_26825/m.80454 type:complete len:168 (+) Transcript_26825:214-717(+)